MQRGLGVVCELEAPLEIGAPWGWGCDRLGVGWEVLGIMKWCCQVRWVAVELLAGGGGGGITLGYRRGGTLGTGGGVGGGIVEIWVLAELPVL